MAQESEQEKTKRDLENLEEILRAADENGLFLEKWEPKHPHSEILDEIYKGKNYIKDPAKTTEARKQYNLAFNKLYSTKNNTRWTWRATYQYGVPMFIYFFVNAIIMFASWISTRLLFQLQRFCGYPVGHFYGEQLELFSKEFGASGTI